MKFNVERSAIEVNIASRDALFRAVSERFSQGAGFGLATLNLDHLSKFPDEPKFTAAYRAMDFVVADGHPIVWLSQIARQPVALLPGSDLVIPLATCATDHGMPIALVGSSDDALAGAKKALEARVPGIDIVLAHAPRYGFDPEGAEADAICDMLVQTGARLCFLALGAPRQEQFATHARDRAPAVGFACIGAGLDFLSGHQVRAPQLMRRMALEWLWRAAQSPRRMVPRYARCYRILPRLLRDALKQR